MKKYKYQGKPEYLIFVGDVLCEIVYVMTPEGYHIEIIPVPEKE